MQKKATIIVVLLVLMVGILSAQVTGQKLSVAVPQLSPATTDVYKKLVTAVIEASGNTLSLQVLPFARCMYFLQNKEIDIVSPTAVIPDKTKWDSLDFDYSTSNAFDIVFVFYTNKSKPIDVAEIKKGNPKGYKIETDVGHTDYFNFPISGSTSFEASLRKVNKGDIDGFIFAQPSCDAIIKAQSLNQISRQYYDSFTSSFLLTKGSRGGEIDKAITAGLTKIKASGKYEEILKAYTAGASVYNDWQP